MLIWNNELENRVKAIAVWLDYPPSVGNQRGFVDISGVNVFGNFRQPDRCSVNCHLK